MDDSQKEQIIASSSAWVASLLNLLPGLGTGYIYQRRWKAYWITTLISAVWFFIDLQTLLGVDLADPAAIKTDQISLIGILAISAYTSLEAWLSVNKIRKN